MPAPHLATVNVGTIRAVPWRSANRTAIDKRPALGPVAARTLGLEGDQIGDTKHHGGVDQAVYAYAREDLDRWQELLGRDLRNGQFGENLTTVGVDVTGAVIGERWQIGTAVLEVAVPRIPCGTFRDFMDEPRWVRRFTEEGRPGAYLRVVQEGVLAAGDTVRVGERPEHGLTVGATFRAMTGNRELTTRLLEAPQLPAKVRDNARQVLSSPPATGRNLA
ncbi:MAG: MOSC domain-containing protein [Actinomycetota bacterium]|nr:MOSC domain-containing protein [Actinomycetota bacterium]